MATADFRAIVIKSSLNFSYNSITNQVIKVVTRANYISVCMYIIRFNIDTGHPSGCKF